MKINPGQKIGRLTALNYSHNKGSAKYWTFKCECSKITTTRLTLVLNGHTRSCGCLRKDMAKRIGL